MIIEKEFYDRCCRAYQRVIDELEEKLSAINAPEDDIPILKQCFSIIMEVSQSYLLPKEYWSSCLDYLRNMEHRSTKDDLDFLCSSTVKRALFHLHFDEEWDYIEFEASVLSVPYGKKHFKFMNFYRTDINSAEEEDLCFPHSRLKECLRHFKSHTSCLPSKKLINRCEEMMKLYPKILSAYEDVDKWFNLLLEVDDFAFIKENIEYRLGKDFVNVHLWKIYFGFLKKHDEYKSLLKAYSKYCRFFLDDKEMLDEYKKEMIKYGPVKLDWENLFDFEVKNNIEAVAENESASVEMEEVEQFDKKICTLFYDTYQRQNFSLPGPQIFYILNNADHRMLRKLFASCKYFFVKHPTPICYVLFMADDQTFFEKENLELSPLSNQIMFVKKTFITGSIQVYPGDMNLSDDDPGRLFISSLIPHLFRCEAKYLLIFNQSLSFDEVKFLIAHGNVVEFHLPKSKILDENGQYVHLEEIMKYLPNIEELE
uniref:Uncharacterized protein n=1 Tax=Panagrolaimus davidi TaxID=227884 RepID=A0A914Q917_9BILA